MFILSIIPHCSCIVSCSLVIPCEHKLHSSFAIMLLLFTKPPSNCSELVMLKNHEKTTCSQTWESWSSGSNLQVNFLTSRDECNVLMLNQRGWLQRCLCWGVLAGKTLTELDRLFWSLFWTLEWLRSVSESARETYQTGRVSDHCLAGGQFLAIYAICKMASFLRILESTFILFFRLFFWRCSSKAPFTTWHEISWDQVWHSG